ncbi:hypothetical protein PTHTG4_39070 [Parageobacillus thermoglucosidasius]|nr:hypothetical protein Geoth_0476 [Parageobacillus thermoglucosidasius C56-YS93]AEH46526.1 hypothetical protein Geoth_0503 [Parageobacillus thermoglucosidasius C56-YS93]GCD84841.1 hypothetical protein PTHTG4_39070 [Parageobacillus thermoglucosidasius]
MAKTMIIFVPSHPIVDETEPIVFTAYYAYERKIAA